MAWKDSKYAKTHEAYHKAHYDVLRYKAHKTDRLPELIAIAADMHNTSPTQYALNAIRDALRRDGVTLESLPPLPPLTPDQTNDADTPTE